MKLSKHRITLLLAALSALGMFLVLVRGSTYGVGVTPDSVTYISTARNLLAGNGFIQWNGSSYTIHPPLFPLLLALTGIFGPDPADTAGYVNAFLCGLAIFLSSRWLWQHLRARPAPTSRALQTYLLLWAAAVLVLSPTLSRIASFAWSEPLFILLTISALFTFNTFLDTGKRASLVLAAIFTALACLTRYVGITIPATMCMLLLLRKGDTPSKKTTDTVIYALIVGTPPCVWLLRNFLVSGTWTGPRYPPQYSFLFNLKNMFVILAGWVLPWPWVLEMENLLARLFSVEEVMPQHLLVLLIPTLLIFGVGAWICFTRLPLHHVRPIVLLATFTSVYLVFLIIAISVLEADPLSRRFLAPVYIPLLGIVVLFLDDLFHYDLQRKLLGTLRFPWIQNVYAEGRIAGLTVVVMALLSCWLWVPVNAKVQHIRQALENGQDGYNSRTWAESEIIRHINENPCARCVFFSPNAPGLYFLTAQPRQFYLPRLLTDDWLRRTEFMQRNGEDVYIIWFFFPDKIINALQHITYDRSQIETELALETVAALADGIIYRLKR